MSNWQPVVIDGDVAGHVRFGAAGPRRANFKWPRDSSNPINCILIRAVKPKNPDKRWRIGTKGYGGDIDISLSIAVEELYSRYLATLVLDPG